MDESLCTRDESLCLRRLTCEALVEHAAHAFAVRKALGDPAVFDLAQDSRHFRPFRHAARDDLAALEREDGDIPAVERSEAGAGQQQAVGRPFAAEAICERTGIAWFAGTVGGADEALKRFTGKGFDARSLVGSAADR